MTSSYLTGPQVKERYQISEMTLWRWVRDEKMGFPQPLVLNRRKLFDADALAEWERQRVKGAA
jgi:predicted DNA-binding transcriptional regulator AlpA